MNYIDEVKEELAKHIRVGINSSVPETGEYLVESFVIVGHGLFSLSVLHEARYASQYD